MTHFLIFIVCILSVELFIRLKFITFELNAESDKKVTYVISQNKISDHWKEKVIPAYALKIMNYSLKILLILLLIISLFFIIDLLQNNFLAFTFSLMGIAQSIVFAFGYVFIRRLFIK